MHDLGIISQMVNWLMIEIFWEYLLLRASYFQLNERIKLQFCWCHDSWAVVAFAKFWPDLIIIF